MVGNARTAFNLVHGLRGWWHPQRWILAADGHEPGVDAGVMQLWAARAVIGRMARVVRTSHREKVRVLSFASGDGFGATGVVPNRPFLGRVMLPEGTLPRPDDKVRVKRSDLFFGRVTSIGRRGHWNRLVSLGVAGPVFRFILEG